MATAVKRKLSASTSGVAILVAATATPGTSIHTAVNSSVFGTFDEIWIWAQNNHTADVILTIEWGNVATKDNIIVNIPYKSGLIPIVPGFILQNAVNVTAFASVTNVISLHGFVNSITD